MGFRVSDPRFPLDTMRTKDMRSLGSRADEDVRSVVWARVWPLLLLELSEPALLVLPMLAAGYNEYI